MVNKFEQRKLEEIDHGLERDYPGFPNEFDKLNDCQRWNWRAS